jgi:hypothetical protein
MTYDGNMLAGPLSEVFVQEVTTAVARCGGCGAEVEMARLVVHGPDPGLTGRCPGCSDVMVRLVRTPDAMWVSLSGTASLRIPVAAPDPAG